MFFLVCKIILLYVLSITSIYAMEKEEEPKITIKLKFTDQPEEKEGTLYELEESILKNFPTIKTTIEDVGKLPSTGENYAIPVNITQDQFTHTLDFVDRCTSFTLNGPKARYAQQRQAQIWFDAIKKQPNYVRIIDDVSACINYLMDESKTTTVLTLYAKELLSNPQFIQPTESIQSQLKQLCKQQCIPPVIQAIKGLPTLLKFQKQEPDEWSEKFYKKKLYQANPFNTIISPQKQYYASFGDVVGEVDIYSIVDDSFKITISSLGEPTAVAFDAYDTSIVVGDRFGGIKKYTIQKNPTEENIIDPENVPTKGVIDYISVCPSDNTIIAYGVNKWLYVLYNDIDNNKTPPAVLSVSTPLAIKDNTRFGKPYCINFTPDGQWLVALYQKNKDIYCTRWSTANAFQKDDYEPVIPWKELIEKIDPKLLPPDPINTAYIKSIKPFLTNRSCYGFSLNFGRDFLPFVLCDFRNKKITFDTNSKGKQRTGNLFLDEKKQSFSPIRDVTLAITSSSVNTINYNNYQHYIPYHFPWFELADLFFNANETVLNFIESNKDRLISYSTYDNCWLTLFDTLEKTDFDLQTLHTLYQNYLKIIDNNKVSDIDALIRLSAGIPTLRNQIYTCLSAKQKALLFYAEPTREKAARAVSAIASIPSYTRSALSAAKIAAVQKLKQTKPSVTVEQSVIAPAVRSISTQPIEQPRPQQIEQAPQAPMQPIIKPEPVSVEVPRQRPTIMQRIGQSMRSMINASSRFGQFIANKAKSMFGY